MTISRLMLATALMGTLALPALAQTHGAMPAPGHRAPSLHTTTLRHRVIKPLASVHPVAAPAAVVPAK